MSHLPHDVKTHFGRFLDGATHLHVASHSHHPWPDVTFAAHQRAWEDAARLHDRKWDVVLGEVIPEAQLHLADRLGLPDPGSLVFAPNTHEFVSRLLSCFEAPIRILTTDAEFHSFRRQVDRLAEDNLVELERIPAEPFETFEDRFAAAAARGGHDLVFFSSVHFNSGFVVRDLDRIVRAVKDPATFVVVDAYHQFMAMPMDAREIADRAFIVGGGYKYAMAGEGACFLHVPEGFGPRPQFTGWYAEFGDLDRPVGGGVGYPRDAGRFWGSTFDPSGIYRLVAVQEWLVDLAIDEEDIHAHVGSLQSDFLNRIEGMPALPFGVDDLVPGRSSTDRGNFLAFAFDGAEAVRRALEQHGVLVDHRGDRLRFGFGIYHDRSDLDELTARLQHAAADL